MGPLGHRPARSAPALPPPSLHDHKGSLLGYSHGPGLHPVTGLGSSNVSQQAAGGKDRQLLTKLPPSRRTAAAAPRERAGGQVDGWLSGQDGVCTGGCGREGALRARCSAGARLPTSVLWPSLVSRVLVLGTAERQDRQPGSSSHSCRAQTRRRVWRPAAPPTPAGLWEGQARC